MVRRKLYLRRGVEQDAPKLPAGHAAALAAAHHAAAPATALQLGAPGQLELLVDEYLDSMVRWLGSRETGGAQGC